MSILTELKRMGNAQVDREFSNLVASYAKDLTNGRSKGNPTVSVVAKRVSKSRKSKKQLTPSQALFVMREAIWKRGWTQGVLTDASGKMCLRGAIVDLVQNGHVHDDDAQIVCQYIHTEVRNRGGGSDKYNFVSWNNDPRRTLADVLKILEDCGNRAARAGE